MLKKLFSRIRGSHSEQLPGYAAQGIIRQGSCAVLFKARRRSDGRTVAIKIMRPEARQAARCPDSIFGDLTEGRILATFDHPNVVRCLEHGVLGKTPYAVLEHLEGATLAEIEGLEPQQLDGRKLQILHDAAAALAHVHQHRFVHHDFCTRNVFVTASGEVRLIDFALATPELDEAAMRVRTGTTEVMAPELVRRDHCDHRIDIFAFGVLAYEMLCGHWPFESPEHHQTMSKILNVRPLPLVRRAPDLPEEVCKLIDRCLVKDPTKRLSTMTSAVGVLERHCSVAV